MPDAAAAECCASGRCEVCSPGYVWARAVNPVCDLSAYRTCSRCYHGAHDKCQHVVKCPDDKRERPCQCCGGKS